MNLKTIILEPTTANCDSKGCVLANHENFAHHILLNPLAGRSNSGEFFLSSATDFTFAHEFGHLLGLEDFYTSTTMRNAVTGGLESVPYSNVEKFGERATTSLMGSDQVSTPDPADIQDILNPEHNDLTEVPFAVSPVYHLDLAGDDVAAAIDLLTRISKDRGVDISTQMNLLGKSKSAQARRRIIEWTFNAVFLDRGLTAFLKE